ncbi:MAG TPA: 4Fe-4S dicluster domain-containing protein [Candidatus Acidoferrales bacterium]|nr:4Fe-4S dicluster domain-containing protein [Candidatus Acidoferrales bacterium]
MGRQIAMVFDLNKCIGCQTCSVACKVLWTNQDGRRDMWWCSVNTQPGRGTPRDYERMGGGYDVDGSLVLGDLPSPEEFGGASQFNWNAVHTSGNGSGHTHLQPTNGKPTWAMNWDEDQGAGEYPNAYYFYMPRICNFCSKPSCVDACPNGALYKHEEFGVALRDDSKCQGAQQCARACPYKKIYFDAVSKTSRHCIGCFPRLEEGVAPACVRQCPGRAVFVGYRDDSASPIHQLVDTYKVALPLHSEWHTEPNVFYVPPLSAFMVAPDGSIDESRRRIPLSYLESLFGPEVGAALLTLEAEMAKRKRGEPSGLMDTLIAYEWKSLLGPFDRDPSTIHW